MYTYAYTYIVGSWLRQSAVVRRVTVDRDIHDGV